MANREACELYIEQEIEEGLKQGKKPYSIGKELAAWIEKLFEVKINPETIRSRARRHKDWSNDQKKSNNVIKTEVYYDPREKQIDSITHPPTDRGGKRDGAGRPQLKYTETHEVSDALFFAAAAIQQLKSIKKEDIKRQEALDKVINWINENR